MKNRVASAIPTAQINRAIGCSKSVHDRANRLPGDADRSIFHLHEISNAIASPLLAFYFRLIDF